MIYQTSSDAQLLLCKTTVETEKESYRLGENNCKLRYVAEDLKNSQTPTERNQIPLQIVTPKKPRTKRNPCILICWDLHL